MDGISLAKGGADEGVLGIVKVIFVVVGLGESTIVIRDSEHLTGCGNPSLSWVGIELQLLLLLLLVLFLVSSLSLLLFLFLLLLLADTGVFGFEVSKCLLDIVFFNLTLTPLSVSPLRLSGVVLVLWAVELWGVLVPS